jgi:hypothetical protein
VTPLSPFLYSVNRRQGAIPESGQTILLTSFDPTPTALSTYYTCTGL